MINGNDKKNLGNLLSDLKPERATAATGENSQWLERRREKKKEQDLKDKPCWMRIGIISRLTYPKIEMELSSLFFSLSLSLLTTCSNCFALRWKIIYQVCTRKVTKCKRKWYMARERIEKKIKCTWAMYYIWRLYHPLCLFKDLKPNRVEMTRIENRLCRELWEYYDEHDRIFYAIDKHDNRIRVAI